MAFFKDLSVTYWSNSIYNASNNSIDAEMNEDYNQPILDSAGNYVCAIERLEVSGNNLPFYDVNTDPESLQEFAISGLPYKRSTIYLVDDTLDIDSGLTIVFHLSGTYYSLQHILDELNEFNLINDPIISDTEPPTQSIYWFLDSGGCIGVQILNSSPNDWISNLNFGKVGFYFDSNILASIMGLPKVADVTISDKTYYSKYSQYDVSHQYMRFKTKSSRIDAGIIPSLIQIRTNLPLESDQSGSARYNIATDFSLIQGSSASSSYATQNLQIAYEAGLDTPATFNALVPVSGGTSWSFNVGGMILYVPNERRWLNFNSMSAIYSVRIWVEYVLSNGTVAKLQIPPGGKFSIKLGFYMKNNM